jgi:SAM-dependent methyltransferase
MKPPSSDKTQQFYSDLMTGRRKRGMWGKDARFSAEAVCSRPLVREPMDPLLAEHLQPDDTVLDLGCGPGTFLPLIAPHCGKLIGADIVEEFVRQGQAVVDRNELAHTELRHVQAELPFHDGEFDAVIMIDTIHHLELVHPVLSEVHRVLTDEGRLLIFEPNRRNWLLWLMCLLDANERGLLSLGTFASYRKLLAGRFRVEQEQWNATLIGPQSRWMTAATRLVSHGFGGRLRGLSPKLFIAARKIVADDAGQAPKDVGA